MKKILLLIAFPISIFGYSQITVTNTSLPSANDTVRVGISNDFATTNTTATGPNHVWDYSNLNVQTQRIDTFFNVSSAPLLYQAVYNNGFTQQYYVASYYQRLIDNNLLAGGGGALPVEISDPMFFTRNTSDTSKIVGLGLKIDGVNVPAKADSVDIVYLYPMEYDDNWDSRSYIYLDFDPAFPAIFKRHQQRESHVDGWGEITTPFGTFDVLRVRSEVNYQDSIYFDIFGTGGTWNELPTPNVVEYTWWSNGMKIPVLKIVAQNDGGTETITSIEFKDKKRDFASIENNENNFSVYPNPANDMIKVILPETSQKIEILDISGKIIYQSENNNLNELNINISNWESGLYILNVYSNNSIQTQKLIVE